MKRKEEKVSKRIRGYRNVAKNTSETGEVPVVLKLDELLHNCKVVDDYLASNKDPEFSYAINLIKRGTCFVAIKKDGTIKFYPSRFVGYIDNSMSKHDNNTRKDGRVTNPAISIILKAEPTSNSALDSAYKNYCIKLGFEPREKGSFGVERKFWEIEQ